MTIRQLTTPWAPGSALYSVPGNLLLKLALGEAPARVPSRRDVRLRLAEPATALDRGPIDRIVRRWADEVRFTRVHLAASALKRTGRRDDGFDGSFGDIEHITGVARTFLLEMSPHAAAGALADALRQLPSVEAVSLNYVTAVPLEAAALDDDLAWSARNLVHGPEALAYEPGDAAVIVGLVDSGIVPNHPELEGRLRSGFDCVHLGRADLAGGMQYLGNVNVTDTNPIDQYVGHGMGCAGIIGALGELVPPGLGGSCQLLPVRVLGAARIPGRAQPVGIGAIADIDAGLKMAIDLGAKVLNLSFGTPDEMLDPAAPKPHAEVIRYALARDAIPVAASGNSGNDEKVWPAAFDGVIAVGSVTGSGEPSIFTTRGPHVAVCAPGERIVTTGLAGYQLATGTSFAAPFVTATAALLVSRAERRSLPIDSALVREVLCTSATPFAAGINGYGGGVLNAYAALQTLDRFIDAAPPGGADKDERELAA